MRGARVSDGVCGQGGEGGANHDAPACLGGGGQSSWCGVLTRALALSFAALWANQTVRILSLLSEG